MASLFRCVGKGNSSGLEQCMFVLRLSFHFVALESVKSFLPQLAAANEVLQQQMVGKPAEEFDIEHVTEEEGPVVEMVRY